MHQYMKAVGFSDMRRKSELKELIADVLNNPSEKKYVESDRESAIVEYIKYYSKSTGLIVRGEYDSENQLTLDFYYPFMLGYHDNSIEDISVERHAMEESYAGILDDPRVGITIIFSLQNCVDVMRIVQEREENASFSRVRFSALSLNGTIMLPIKKNPCEKAKIEKSVNDRNKLIMAARRGDETAIESLTLDDIDTYAVISRKIRKEDIYSLVDSYFMPYGVECDQYSIMGEIEEYSIEVNSRTGEELYILLINYNGLYIDICINRNDLLGEPEIGRRFKGSILLQGHISIEE